MNKIKVEWECGDERVFDTLELAKSAILDAVGVSPVSRVYRCDSEGDELEDGQEYELEWQVTLVPIK